MTENEKPATGTATETVTVSRGDGTSFAITIARAAADAPLVLVVPAMGLQARWYRRLLTNLNNSGCHVAVTELRGHEGQGGHRPSRSYDFGYADLVDDLGQAVDALTARLLGHFPGNRVGFGAREAPTQMRDWARFARTEADPDSRRRTRRIRPAPESPPLAMGSPS